MISDHLPNQSMFKDRYRHFFSNVNGCYIISILLSIAIWMECYAINFTFLIIIGTCSSINPVSGLMTIPLCRLCIHLSDSLSPLGSVHESAQVSLQTCDPRSAIEPFPTCLALRTETLVNSPPKLSLPANLLEYNIIYFHINL